MKIYDPVLLGLEVVKSMGDELLVFCPYHFDSNPSAEYNLSKGLFYCFGCHEAKNAKQVAEDLGGSLVAMSFIPAEYIKISGDGLGWLSLIRNPLAIGNDYLVGRGVLDYFVEKYDIRSNDEGIIFPLKDLQSKIKGVQIRHFDKMPKYKFYGQRTPVWPMETLTEDRIKEDLFITEGIFGALRIKYLARSYEYLGDAIAIMGSSSIKKTVQLIKRLDNRNPYALMDGDFAGRVAAGKFILLGFPAIILPKKCSPPDELSIKEFTDIKDNLDDYLVYDVMDLIEKTEESERLQMVLEKFWRKM